MRTSPVHYIAPSAISIIPNCNGSANDLAVTIGRGVKIKVYCPRAGIDKVKETGEYQEWILAGRNRRLADSTKPYTIYARLPKSDKTKGYIVFSPMTPYPDDVWIEKHLYLDPDTLDGLADLEGAFTEDGNWWVKLGDVSRPDANNQRTVTLDTGILGTEQFNSEWALRPDELPLRIELGCTINDEDAGPTPYVYWGQSVVLTAMLTEGWTGTDIQRFDRWEIVRNSGDAAADDAWNYQEVEGQDTLTPRLMPDGQITLNHARGTNDDFNGAVAVTFTILAVGHNADTLQSEILKTTTINIMAETMEKYELSLSESIVSYDPQTQNYSPAGGVDVGIRATDQRNEVFDLTREQIANASLMAEYAPVGSSSWKSLSFKGTSQEAATANIDTTAFALQQSLNVRLMRRITADGQTVSEKELSRATIAFVRNGEDSKIREWIYRLNSNAGYDATTGTAGGTAVSGKTDGVDNCLLVDDFVPSGWSDDPTGVSQPGDVEWESWRDYDDDNHRWGAFHTPVIHNRYAEDAVTPEQIFLHTSNYPWVGKYPVSANIDGAIPSGWSAVPVGVTQLNPYEYRSIRRKTGGVWGAWSAPQLDAKWSSDGTSISIKGDANAVIGWEEILPETDDNAFLCLMNNADSDDIKIYEIDDWQQQTGSWKGYSAEIGDIYLLDGDMWMKQNNAATASSPRWKNLGRIQGPAGNDGKNAVRIDLDNQADIIACRENGTVRFTRVITIHAKVNDGPSAATTGVSTTQTVQDMEIAGVTPTTFSLVDGLLTVTWQFVAGTVLAPGSYVKEITLNYNGESYTAQFSLTSSNTTAIYQLHPSMSEVSFQVDSNGDYAPTTQRLYCGYTMNDGGAVQTFPGNNIANLWREGGAPYNIFWRRQLSGGMFSNWNWAKDLTNGTLTIDSTTTDMGIEFAMSSAYSISEIRDENIVDRELVAIVKGGQNGPKGDDAQEVSPNILLRTIFDRGIDFVLEAWYRNSDSYVTIDTYSDTVVNGRKSIRLNAKDNGAETKLSQSLIGKLKANTWYTLSFNAFLANGGGRLVVSLLNLFDGTRTNIFGNNLKVILDGEDYQVSNNGFNDVLITGGWDGKRHTITFLTNSNISTETLNLQFYQAYGSGTGNHSISCICMPKLEEGRTATAYMAHESDLKGDNAPYNEHAYALSRSRTSHADEDLYQVNGVRWFPSAPDPRATHPYVWERIMHYTAAGVNDQTSYICLTGAVGAMGKLCYMAGEYREDVEYTSNDSQTVAVEVSGTGETTSIYYLNAESNWPDGTAQSAIGPTDSGQTIWVLGMSQYNLVRARYLFADFAQFGAAVVSGDWLISVHGTINGTEYHGKYEDPDTYINSGDEKPTYFWFDPAYPNEDHAGKYKTPGSSSSGQWASDHHNFIPNYAVNLLTGKTYQNDAYIRGEVHATSGDFKNVKISGGMRSPFTYITPNSTFDSDFSDNVAVHSIDTVKDQDDNVLPTEYTIPWDSSQSGRRIIVANYKWGTGTLAKGFAKLNAPNGKYFYEDGVMKTSIQLSREVVELIGYGDSSSFYGWIVLTRTDIGTEYKYGHHLSALAIGKTIVENGVISEGKAIGLTFDGSGMSVRRLDVGKYKVTFENTSWFQDANGVHVTVSGYGNTSNGPLYASVHSIDTTGFEVWTGDDSSPNDGSFTFIVMNIYNWLHLNG